MPLSPPLLDQWQPAFLTHRGVNASAESVIGLFKTEVIRLKGPWRHLEAVEFATLEWVDWFSHRRLLEPIGDMPPAEYEARYYDQGAVAQAMRRFPPAAEQAAHPKSGPRRRPHELSESFVTRGDPERTTHINRSPIVPARFNYGSCRCGSVCGAPKPT